MPCGFIVKKVRYCNKKSLKSLRRFYLLDRVSGSDDQTDRERQTDGQRDRQMEIERQPDGQRDRQMEIERQPDGQRDRQMEIERQPDGQRETDRWR